MGKQSICVMMVIQTDDPRLSDMDVSSAAKTAALRKAVIDNLATARVIAVMSEEASRLMMMGHDIAANAAGYGGTIHRPPRDYVPPTND
jgi:hypothetical protein